MISVWFYKNDNDAVYGFRINNHGNPIVCSAVSALSISCANSLEAFTDCALMLDYNEKGGKMKLAVGELQDGGAHFEAELLLKSMELGIGSVRDSYPNELEVKYKKNQSIKF